MSVRRVTLGSEMLGRGTMSVGSIISDMMLEIALGSSPVGRISDVSGMSVGSEIPVGSETPVGRISVGRVMLGSVMLGRGRSVGSCLYYFLVYYGSVESL